MAVLMAAAALWGVLQLFTLAWPTRSVRLSTVLLALMVGIYGCGTATALIEVTYTRLYADQSGHPLTEVVNTTSYTVAPWVEELLKLSPLLLSGLYAKVRRQWGLTDFVVLGSAVGAGFGLLEALLRFGGEAKRAIPRPGGGWVIPDGFYPPYVPGRTRCSPVGCPPRSPPSRWGRHRPRRRSRTWCGQPWPHWALACCCAAAAGSACCQRCRSGALSPITR